MMANRDQDIKERLLAVFQVEAEEHLQALTANLLALENGIPPEQARQVIEATFREAHTLKGAARSVSLMEVEAVCQAIESVLSRITHGRLELSPPILNQLQEAVDGVAHLLAGSANSTAAPDLVRCLEEATGETGVRGQRSGDGDQSPSPTHHPPTPASPSTPVPHADSIRLSTAKLDALLVQTEDLLVPKLAAEERVREVKALVETLKQGLGVRGQRLENGDQNPSPIPHPPTPVLRALQGQVEDLLRHLTSDQRTISRTVDSLHEELRRTRLTPASIILDLFPRMVRDVARAHGKEVEWRVQGADLEVDRKILETMKDPLIHLVRNAIDHGIDPPEARVQAGKAVRGQVAVSVTSLEGGRIEICVQDDGRGIDLARVRAAAVRARLLSAEDAEAKTDDDALDLIFRSGLSTSPMITDLSGHGLGLAIVKEGVERLGGRIQVETQAGAGTTIRMILPASITTFRGLLVQAGGQPFLLPTEAVERAIRIAPEDVASVERRQAIRWNGQPLYLARLSELLGVAERTEQAGFGSNPLQGPDPSPLGGGGNGWGGASRKQPCVIVGSGDEQVGLIVEAILGEQEVLVKQFGPPLVRVKHVAAAGLLGTGRVVLILRPADLVMSARQSPRASAPPTAAEELHRQSVILVVDDSITTRTMERNILEASGYQVRVAVDGLDAWTALKSEAVDLVVSDVDMPRMDGFELTARIRADRELSDLPVLLVTALESREDKERGIEVGANAYIVKSSFERSNWLEIIRRLV